MDNEPMTYTKYKKRTVPCNICKEEYYVKFVVPIQITCCLLCRGAFQVMCPEIPQDTFHYLAIKQVNGDIKYPENPYGTLKGELYAN